MAAKRKEPNKSEKADRPRFSVSLDAEVKANYDLLCDVEGRSTSNMTEQLIKVAVQDAINKGTITPKGNITSTKVIGYDAALTICISHSIDNVVRLKAVAETARALRLDAEELLAQCHQAGLRTINGNGNKAKVGTTT